MDFLQNTRYSLAVAADFNARYDRLLMPSATVAAQTPASNLRTNNRIAGW